MRHLLLILFPPNNLKIPILHHVHILSSFPLIVQIVVPLILNDIKLLNELPHLVDRNSLQEWELTEELIYDELMLEV